MGECTSCGGKDFVVVGEVIQPVKLHKGQLEPTGQAESGEVIRLTCTTCETNQPTLPHDDDIKWWL
jgi:hypothetical protein